MVGVSREQKLSLKVSLPATAHTWPSIALAGSNENASFRSEGNNLQILGENVRMGELSPGYLDSDI